MSSRRHHRARPATAVLAAILLAGCSVARVDQPSPDDFAAWSERPLPPDPNLASLALAEGSTCASGEDNANIRILVQDRRTAQTAAFLVAGPTTFGSCLITSGGGMSSGGSGPALEPMIGLLSVDDNGAGGGDGINLRELGGRVTPAAAQVVIHLTDGRSIPTSIGNGYWLAWWPDRARAERVVATDASGAEIASTEVIE